MSLVVFDSHFMLFLKNWTSTHHFVWFRSNGSLVKKGVWRKLNIMFGNYTPQHICSTKKNDIAYL